MIPLLQIPKFPVPTPAPLRAGCEPFSIWEGIDPKSEEYRKLKEERAQVLMDAVEVRAVWVCVRHVGVCFSATCA